MKKLLLSFLVILSMYNYALKKDYRAIPVITIISKIEDHSIKYNDDLLGQVIYDEVANFYKSTSNGRITLYKPKDSKLSKVKIPEIYKYEERKMYGLKSIIKSAEYINYAQFDTNNNNIIERDELIILNVLETKDTYNKPIASTIKTRDFYIENLKIKSYIQLGIHEVFSNRESLLTPSTVAHEIGHHFGLPDLYDTDHSSKGLGPMSLMSEIHSDQPINFDPWSKLYLGIEKPLIIKKNGIHLIEKEKIYLVQSNKNWIYYLIERRSFQRYDKSLSKVMSSDGIFIYRINEKVINETIHLNHVNRDEKQMGVKFLGNEVIDEIEGIYLKGIDSNRLLIENKKN